MTRSTPATSVVIPAYNAELWLGHTLESFTRQTVTDFEVIVVDDGSQDRTVGVAEGFRDRLDLQVIREAPSGAPAHPCNVGTRAARGELIVSCDADDLARPERIEWMLRAWDAVGRRDCLIFSDFSEVDERGRGLKQRVLPEYSSVARLEGERVAPDISLIPRQAGFEALLEGCFMRPCAAAVPKRVVAEVGWFDERLRNGQDYDLYARIARQFPLVHVDRVLGAYRRAPGNISSRSALSVAPSRLAVLHRLLGMTFTGAQARLVRGGLASNYEALGYEYGKIQQVGESLRAYARAFYHSPAPMHLWGMAGTLLKALGRPPKLRR